jgi:hypothetical protein
MLYKNDEQIKLNKAEIDSIVKHFHGKFPVKIVYPQERIVKSRLAHNRLPDSPNSISFDLKSIVKTENGAEVWRYAEQVIIDNGGKKRYVPKKFRFNGARFLERNDIELIYFLLNKSEHCKGGKNQGRMVKFVFEDLVTEAEKKAEKKELETKIGMLLYNKDMGLSEERLRLVAKAYFIKNVDELTLPQVKILLEAEIHKSKSGADKFFDMVNADEELNSRASIQKAVDMKLLVYDLDKKAWGWKTAEGKIEQICKVPPTETPNDALYKTFMGNNEFREDVQAALLTKNPKAGKGKGGDVPAEDNKE